jgi:hypothetical protein
LKNKIFLIFLLSLLFQNLTTAQSNFKLEISTDKYNYSALEDIWGTIKLTNVGDEVDSIKYDLTYNIFTIDEKGVLGGCVIFVDFMGHYRCVKLNPGETNIYNFNVRADYGRTKTTLFAYYKEGNYRVYCKLKDDRLYNIYSDTAKFSVKGLTEEEIKFYNKKVFPIEEVASKIWNEDYREKNSEYVEKLIDISREFLYKHPNSIFTRYVLEYSNGFRIYGKNRFNEIFFKDNEFFISKNPDSEYIKTILFHYFCYFIDNEQRVKGLEYFDYLRKKYDSPNLNKYIEEYLLKLSKK